MISHPDELEAAIRTVLSKEQAKDEAARANGRPVRSIDKLFDDCAVKVERKFRPLTKMCTRGGTI
jgi:hypothetical protein